MQQLKKYKPGTAKRITAGRHLHVNGMEWRERVFPHTDHDASLVTPCILDHPRLTEVLFLLIFVSVSAVVFHYQHSAAKWLEHQRPLPGRVEDLRFFFRLAARPSLNRRPSA